MFENIEFIENQTQLKTVGFEKIFHQKIVSLNKNGIYKFRLGLTKLVMEEKMGEVELVKFCKLTAKTEEKQKEPHFRTFSVYTVKSDKKNPAKVFIWAENFLIYPSEEKLSR